MTSARFVSCVTFGVLKLNASETEAKTDSPQVKYNAYDVTHINYWLDYAEGV